MFEAVGYRVERLLRIRIGNLCVGDLPCGHWRAVTKSELRSLEGRAQACPRPAARKLHSPL
jgi:16S rRNA U516 pseudouridylate synthase RsuA-like enzyme